MSSEQSPGRTSQCIRCDKHLDVSPGQDLRERGYHTLAFHQEKGALPICDDCFEEVRGRDLWKR